MTPDRFPVARATYLIMAVFLLQPLALGGWFALIPYVKESLGLSKGQLALALLGLPLALVPCLQFASRVIASFGPRRVVRFLFPLQSLAFVLPLVAWNGPVLFLSLMCVGAAMAFIEVAMNVYAGRLEKQTDALIMNRCHGFWALGLFVGSGVVALLADWSPLGVQTGLAIVAAIGGVWVGLRLPALHGEDSARVLPRRALRDLPAALFFIAVFMFLVTLTEGAMADWAAVYLAERLGSVDARASIAVTIFSGFLAGGRFIGDLLKARLGAVTMARVTTTAAFLGLLLVVLPLPLVFAYPGFALVGFGVSAAYPLGVSAIAALDDEYEAANIAIMATVAMGGVLVGPPMIGFLSESFSLAVGLGALLPGLILAIWLTKWLRPAESKPIHPPIHPEKPGDSGLERGESR